jgi:hypothetical protein
MIKRCQAICIMQISDGNLNRLGEQCHDVAVTRVGKRHLCWVHAHTVKHPAARMATKYPLAFVGAR